MRHRTYLLAVLLGIALWAAGPFRLALAQSILPGPLVTAAWLAEKKGRVVLLDVRQGASSFTGEGHIPGAVLVDWKEVRATVQEGGYTLQDMVPPPDIFGRLMRKSGVNADSTIVITSRGIDPEDMFLATRLFWQLKYFGHDTVAVLDGGTGAWAVEGRGLAKVAPKLPKPGTWSAKPERRELLAASGDVETAIQSRAPALTDSRRIANYIGIEQYKEKVAKPGHIPGAKFADATLFLQQSRPVRFRPPEELRQIAEGLGINPNAPMITYCDTGDWASGTWFVFHQLLGNRATRLYDGSMHGWTRDPKRPTTLHKLE